jgi:hypothetical protein
VEIALFESGVAEVFNGRCDGEDVFAFPFGLGGFLVVREVFVGVAGYVGGFRGRVVEVGAFELAAV